MHVHGMPVFGLLLQIVVYGESLTRFIAFATGLQKLYKGIHSLPCYERCYGISASVISQLVLHDEGTKRST